MTKLPDPDLSKVKDEDELNKLLIAALAASNLEAQKAASEASLEQAKDSMASAKAEVDADAALEKAEFEQELELEKLYHQEIADLATGAIDRARDSAKFTQTASAALMTANVALLGLVFSVSGKPLPLRGVYSAIFFAVAISLAVAYLAFLKGDEDTIGAYEPGVSTAETQLLRTAALIAWVNAGARKRRSALRGSVVAMAFGVAFIPAAFIGPTGGAVTATAAAPSPPVIPSAIPEPIEEKASELFTTQADAYLQAIEPQVAQPEIAEDCGGRLRVLRACAWATESAVEQSFAQLALLGLAFVLLVPAVWLFLDRRGRVNRQST